MDCPDELKKLKCKLTLKTADLLRVNKALREIEPYKAKLNWIPLFGSGDTRGSVAICLGGPGRIFEYIV